MTDNTDEPTKAELAKRVDQLETQVNRLTPDGDQPTVAQDDSGTEWSIARLLQFGLTRREAMAALGLLGSGVAFREAFVRVAAADLNDGDTQWGSDSNRDDYVVDHLDANVVDTGALTHDRDGSAGDSGLVGEYSFDNNLGTWPDSYAYQTAIGTTTTDLCRVPSDSVASSMVLIAGIDRTASPTDRFRAILHVNSSNASIINEDTDSNPPSRTYGVNTTGNWRVSITMGGGNFDVAARSVTLGGL